MQIYFNILKFFSSNYFFYSRNKKRNLFYLFLWIIFKFLKLSFKKLYFLFSKEKKLEFLNIFFLYFDNYNKYHYSDEGEGYRYQNRLEEKIAYKKNVSRLELLENYNLINFDKDRIFLDVGCGKGENIKYLLEKYNFSHIEGIDINAKAIEIIKKNTIDKKLHLINNDISDLKYLSELKNNNYDYVLISHVLSTIFKKSFEKTIFTRIEIINQLFRITKCKLIIIDHPSMFKKNYSFDIEQKTRGLFWNNLFNEIKKITSNYQFINDKNSSYLIINK